MKKGRIIVEASLLNSAGYGTHSITWVRLPDGRAGPAALLAGRVTTKQVNSLTVHRYGMVPVGTMVVVVTCTISPDCRHGDDSRLVGQVTDIGRDGRAGIKWASE